MILQRYNATTVAYSKAKMFYTRDSMIDTSTTQSLCWPRPCCLDLLYAIAAAFTNDISECCSCSMDGDAEIASPDNAALD